MITYHCKECNKDRIKFDNFVTLPIPLPFVFDIDWIFVPSDSSVRSMKHKLMDLPVKEEKLSNGQSNHDLKLLKKRFSVVVGEKNYHQKEISIDKL